MQSLKLKKHTWQRRRFVSWNKSQDSQKLTFENWFSSFIDLKHRLNISSHFQIIGSKVILEMDLENKETLDLLLEVLGPPQQGFHTFDENGPFEVLSLEIAESSFEIDFESLLAKASEIKRAIPRNLRPIVHFVVDGPKLALHFFVQKDYIQG